MLRMSQIQSTSFLWVSLLGGQLVQLGQQSGLGLGGGREGAGVVCCCCCSAACVFCCRLRWYLSWLLMFGYSLVILSLSISMVIQLFRSPNFSRCSFIFSLARNACAKVSYSTKTQVLCVGRSLRLTSKLRTYPKRENSEERQVQLVNCGSLRTDAQSTGMRCSLISQRGLLLTTLKRLRWSAKKILKLLLWVWCRVVLMLWQSAQALDASSTLKYFTNTKFFITYTSSIQPYFAKNDRIDCSPASYNPETYNSRTKMHSWIFSGDCACSISSFCLGYGSFENISCTARSQVIVLFRSANRIFWSRYSILLSSSRRQRERERE